MAITPEKTQIEFDKRILGFFKKIEKVIDCKLVINLLTLKEKGIFSITEFDVADSAGLDCMFCYCISPAYRYPLIKMILDNYKSWNIEYEKREKKSKFIFHYPKKLDINKSENRYDFLDVEEKITE